MLTSLSYAAMRLILFNKPYAVLPQFTASDGRRCLRDFVPVAGVYPAGRLDYDSEGLLLLTDFGPWQARISQPGSPFAKRYLVQVEGEPDDAALEPIRRGLLLKDGPALPAPVERIQAPSEIWPRDPPVRYRRAIPTSWLQLDLHEGRNRQVRRMTAAIGYPTLRLIRWSIGPWSVADLDSGAWREVPTEAADAVLAAARPQSGGQGARLRPRGRAPRSASRARGPARS